MIQWHLLVAFTRANLLGYGGGPSVIPLIKVEVVDTFRWMSAEEFGDALALGNSLPGPIATKMAAYVGYKIGGPLGAALGLIGTVLPTALIMIGLVAALTRLKDSPMMQGMITGVKPVVFILFILLALEFLPYVRPDQAGWLPAAIAVGAFIGIYFFHMHQALAVLAALIIGGLFIR
jgi:chromate transporter